MKISFILFVAALVCMRQPADAQVGSVFPAIEGETVHDKKVSIPYDTKGKYTLIGMAFSKKSEEMLNSWFNPVYRTFIQKPTGLFADFAYDVNVYFIPMFTGLKGVAVNSAKNKTVKHLDPRLLEYVVFYKGKLAPYEETLGLDDNDLPYFFVLDKNGKIVYATSGRYTAEKLSDAEALIVD